MWQRFTERARKVVFYAQEEAQRFGDGYVSTEHLLLGLVRDSDTIAARVLEKIGVSLNRVRIEVEKQLPSADSHSSTEMTLTPRAKRVIDLSAEEARNLNNNYIGTEHLLLGLIRESDGLAGRALTNLGVSLEQARREVMELQDRGVPPKAGIESAPPKPVRSYAWTEYEDDAQRTMLLADEMAKAAGESQVTPFFIVLALLSQPESDAAHVLRKSGIDPLELEREVLRSRVWAEGGPEIALSARARQVVDATCEEANSLDSARITTADLLLGLAFGNRDGVGKLLTDLGTTPAKLRSAFREIKEAAN